MNSRVAETKSGIEIEISVAGVLFDMDGVLVSSTLGDERCWTRWASHHGLSDTFDLRGTHGRRAVDTILEYLPNLTPEETARHLAQLEASSAEEQSGVVAYPGASALLASIPPGRWTIVTSASERTMRSRLSAVGITPPAQTVGADRISKGKPHPEGYLMGAALLGQRPEECLVIEDAPAGIRAGKTAGCRVLAVASSHSLDELQGADWIVASIDQIGLAVNTHTDALKLRFPVLKSKTESA
ncbi:HAD-IA family hydrolase [Granulicella sibirica]|uniref:Putative phosphatase YfbT n=1 Tax=Granulicella sibirica TaxID=2479048 RepID=A0A4Q0SYQ4_9BACT|nr:HAD-IA family hydrolase [Granulicella sibirica]RXH55552.1 putative phosphatase YfbT [Granulicella sibirica]